MIHTSWAEIRRASRYAPINNVLLTVVDRKVPAGLVRLKIHGQIMYQAPIYELANSSTMYRVSEEIEVELKADTIYIVRGELDAQRQLVWLEELGTRARVGRTLPNK